MKVKDIMTKTVISAYEDESIKEVVLRLRKNNIVGLPVLKKDGSLVGDFSETDIIKLFPDIFAEAEDIPLVDIRELVAQPIKDVMNTETIVLFPDDSIKDASKLMLEKFVHRIIIIDGNKIIGLISIGDVLKACSLMHG
jgi:CBS domain-containing protein